MRHQKRLMQILMTIDTIWLNEVQPASSNWTSQISYIVIASLLRTPSVCAVLISFIPNAARYNGPPEAAHAHSDDDKGDMVE